MLWILRGIHPLPTRNPRRHGFRLIGIGIAIGFDRQNISIANPIPIAIAMVKIHAIALTPSAIAVDTPVSSCYFRAMER